MTTKGTRTVTTYYKATGLDGRSFKSPKVDYAAALASGDVIRHTAAKKVRNDPSTYLSVSVEPADCTGFQWPCRLFRVEPVGRTMARLDASPNKRAVSALRVVEELPALLALGHNGEAVARLIEATRHLTREQAEGLRAWDAARDAARDAALYAAWDAARYAAWDAARYAACDAALYAAWDAARYAARDAALAILVRDRITADQYATLTQPWREVIGPELVA